MNKPSICIPRTSANISRNKVKLAFEQLTGSGSIKQIDIVRKKNKVGDYQSIFIHLHEWPDTENAQKIRKVLLGGNHINLMYEYPWFWKCFANS